jgi:predicted membrane protein
VGIFGLAIALIAAVGFLSRRIEYAIIFAMILSAILIAFFLFV